jgi:hypothetical protein
MQEEKSGNWVMADHRGSTKMRKNERLEGSLPFLEACLMMIQNVRLHVG